MKRYIALIASLCNANGHQTVLTFKNRNKYQMRVIEIVILMPFKCQKSNEHVSLKDFKR